MARDAYASSHLHYWDFDIIMISVLVPHIVSILKCWLDFLRLQSSENANVYLIEIALSHHNFVHLSKPIPNNINRPKSHL